MITTRNCLMFSKVFRKVSKVTLIACLLLPHRLDEEPLRYLWWWQDFPYTPASFSVLGGVQRGPWVACFEGNFVIN